MVQEHLGLVLQAAEGRGVDDPIAIALEFRASRARAGGEKPAAAERGIGSIGGAFTHYAAKTLFIVV